MAVRKFFGFASRPIPSSLPFPWSIIITDDSPIAKNSIIFLKLSHEINIFGTSLETSVNAILWFTRDKFKLAGLRPLKRSIKRVPARSRQHPKRERERRSCRYRVRIGTTRPPNVTAVERRANDNDVAFRFTASLCSTTITITTQDTVRTSLQHWTR